MSYPKYMTDEGLVVFAFAIDPDNPERATSKNYPTLTRRCRCPKCGLWASTMKGGKGKLVCEQCHKGGKPATPSKQFRKIYECCGNESCPTWQAVLSILRRYGVSTDSSYDRFGSYVWATPLPEWDQETIVRFHLDLSQHCVSKNAGRKAECKKTGTLRSKLKR